MNGWVFVVALVACSHVEVRPTVPEPAPPPPPVVAAALAGPLQVPQYPGATLAGALGGPNLAMMWIVAEPVEQVRAFFETQSFSGFEGREGDLTQSKPLCVVDRSHDLRRCIWLEPQDDTTLVYVRSSSLK